MGKFMVYPGHGVARVLKIETKEILGSKHRFISLMIIDSSMRILVPENAAETVGLRPVMDRETAAECRRLMCEPKEGFDSRTWNARYREYMESIKSGEPLACARVVGELMHLREFKELTFGERKMLDNARSLLEREIAVVLQPEVYAL